MSSTLGERLAFSKAVIEEAVARFGVEGLCLSFNGGKDSTVLLHLLREVLPEHFQRIPCIYFQQSNEFQQVESFVKQMRDRYNLNLVWLESSFKNGLRKLQEENPSIKAIFMGTRHGDPHTAGLSTFSPTSAGWPEFVRVLPILDWSFGDVWDYLEDKPYCALYDEGYTSLGSTVDTRPNEALRLPDGTYRAAKFLRDGNEERKGREHK
eukprot:m.38757 g.38757  ORF g.38757 m.38757 type:complete len:209 (-) comp13859_c0_seq2:29-655(-)